MKLLFTVAAVLLALLLLGQVRVGCVVSYQQEGAVSSGCEQGLSESECSLGSGKRRKSLSGEKRWERT